MPGFWMLTNSVAPSGEKQGAAELRLAGIGVARERVGQAVGRRDGADEVVALAILADDEFAALQGRRCCRNTQNPIRPCFRQKLQLDRRFRLARGAFEQAGNVAPDLADPVRRRLTCTRSRLRGQPPQVRAPCPRPRANTAAPLLRPRMREVAVGSFDISHVDPAHGIAAVWTIRSAGIPPCPRPVRACRRRITRPGRAPAGSLAAKFAARIGQETVERIARISR